LKINLTRKENWKKLLWIITEMRESHSVCKLPDYTEHPPHVSNGITYFIHKKRSFY